MKTNENIFLMLGSKLMVGLLLVFSLAAIAEESCSIWMWQKEGLYWRQCVRDDGTRYCQEADDANGKNVRTVSCAPRDSKR